MRRRTDIRRPSFGRDLFHNFWLVVVPIAVIAIAGSYSDDWNYVSFIDNHLGSRGMAIRIAALYGTILVAAFLLFCYRRFVPQQARIHVWRCIWEGIALTFVALAIIYHAELMQFLYLIPAILRVL